MELEFCKVIPEFLTKDELIFEIKIRGESPVVDASGLRKQLRKVLSELKRYHYVELADYNSADEIKVIEVKILVLSSLMAEFDFEPMSSALKKIETRYSHIANRIVYFSAFNENLPDKPLTSNVDEFKKSLGSFLLNIKSLKEKSSETGVQIPVSKDSVVLPGVDNTTAASAVDNTVSNLVNPSVLPDGALNVLSDSNFPCLSTANVSLPVNNCVVPNQSFNPYSTIKNPVQDLIKNLSLTDGLNVSQLLDFLRVTIKIKKCGLLSDNNLLILLMPYVSGPLLDKVQCAIKQNFSFDIFHQDLINTFIPSRLFFQLQQELFYRLQKTNEPFSFFIQSIKDSAELLKLKVDEGAIVSTIIEGLSPEERSRLVFERRPHNFFELEQICINSQNVAYTDLQRTLNFGTRQPITNSNVRFPALPPVRNQNSQITYNNNKSNFNPRFQNSPNRMFKTNDNDRIVQRLCFKCGKPGHFAAKCNFIPSNNNKNKDIPKNE